jgi:hypothetical protein
MRTFAGSRTFEEIAALCVHQGVPLNAKRYIEDGHDHIIVGQEWPLDASKPYVIYNVFNGKFHGLAPDGTVFDCADDLEGEPWFNALLDFFYITPRSWTTSS